MSVRTEPARRAAFETWLSSVLVAWIALAGCRAAPSDDEPSAERDASAADTPREEGPIHRGFRSELLRVVASAVTLRVVSREADEPCDRLPIVLYESSRWSEVWELLGELRMVETDVGKFVTGTCTNYGIEFVDDEDRLLALIGFPGGATQSYSGDDRYILTLAVPSSVRWEAGAWATEVHVVRSRVPRLRSWLVERGAVTRD